MSEGQLVKCDDGAVAQVRRVLAHGSAVPSVVVAVRVPPAAPKPQ